MRRGGGVLMVLMVCVDARCVFCGELCLSFDCMFDRMFDHMFDFMFDHAYLVCVAVFPIHN